MPTPKWSLTLTSCLLYGKLMDMKKLGIVNEIPGRGGGASTPVERFWSRVNKHGPFPPSMRHLGRCWIWEAAKNDGDYGMVRMGDGNPKLAHRVSYELEIGPIPDGHILDHRCRVHECVRPSHLRPVTHGENSQNRARTSKSRSGIRGVVWNSKAGKWQSRVFMQGKYHHAGLHENLEDAAEAVRLKRIEVHTHNDTDRNHQE